MHKKFEINWTKIKGGCQSGRKVVTHNSKSDLPLVFSFDFSNSELVLLVKFMKIIEVQDMNSSDFSILYIFFFSWKVGGELAAEVDEGHELQGWGVSQIPEW